MTARYFGELQTDTYGINADEGKIALISLSAAQAAAAGSVHAAITGSSSAVTTVTTAITNPPYPRNLVITPGGTTTDVAACSITVTGTNIADEIITEDFAFLANATGATVGAKAFKTVTSIAIPIQDGAAATFAVTFGDKLGMPYLFDKKTLVMSVFNGTIETTAATQVIDADELEKNTVDLNSALNGSTVDLYFVV